MPIDPEILKAIQDAVGAGIAAGQEAQTQAIMGQVDRLMDQRMKSVTDTINKVLEMSGESENAQGQENSALGGLMTQFVHKLLGAPVPGSPDMKGQLGQMAELFTTIRQVFLEPQQESMRVGMKLAADSFGYAARATGLTPDPAKYAELIDGAGQGSRNGGGKTDSGLVDRLAGNV